MLKNLNLCFNWVFTKAWKFFEKPEYLNFTKKRQNHIFGQFWPQIRKEFQKLGG
jgi:hypothetical protein